MSAVGTACILLACLAFARRLVQEQKKRLAVLRSLSSALTRLRAELSLRLTSLPELSETLSREASGAAGDFFAVLHAGFSELGEKPFPVLWAEAARDTLSALSPEEQGDFCCLGETLGRYELGEQLAAIDLCRASIDKRSAALAEALPNRRRLAYGLLSAAGALLSIILIS